MAASFPSAGELVQRPATAGLAALAVGVAAMQYAGLDIDVLAMRGDALIERPWTALTSALVHVSPLHLIFNLYWLCVLGVHVERELGSARTLLAYALWGIAANLGEHALFWGGVGLSGIGYGIVAYGWVRGQSDLQWAEWVDGRTAFLFAAWFVFCVITTITGVLPVGNVAHGVGAIAGALTGAMMRPTTKIAGAVGALVVGVIAVGVDLPVARDRLNLVGAPALDAERRGLAALELGDAARAVIELEHADALGPDDPRRLQNLAVAYHRAERVPELCATYDRLLAIERPIEAEPRHRMDAAYCHGRLGVAALESDRNEDAIASLEAARAIAEDDGYVLYNLAVAYRRAGREAEACDHFVRASDRLADGHDAAARCLADEALALMDATPPDAASAEALLARARRLDPDSASHAYNHGVSLTHLSRDDDAIDAFTTAERGGHTSASEALRFVLWRRCEAGECERCRTLVARGSGAPPCP